MTRPLTLLLAALLVATTACEVAYEPDVGARVADAGGAHEHCIDSDPVNEVSFARDIVPLLARSSGGCNCHGAGATAGFSLAAYDSLRRGGANSGTRVVVPGKPCESILLQKLGTTPPFGSRMPFNGPPYFTADERRIVGDWISEGAQNN